ncbi:MAG: NUDIX domain-containing protein [Patescibacteria group bacterium]|jgi:mutator protein MutT
MFMPQRVRAIIIKNNKLLTIKRVKKDSTYFVFPGGGVEPGEKPEDALKRECREELGVEVGIKEKFGSEIFERGEIEQEINFYICEIITGKIGTGDGPEYAPNTSYEGSYEIKWLAINSLSNFNLQPIKIRDEIMSKIFTV